MSQERPQALGLSTLGSDATGPNDGQESRIPLQEKETPPSVTVAGISHFRSKGRDNLKMPQFLEILWDMESIGISPAPSSTGTQGIAQHSLVWPKLALGSHQRDPLLVLLKFLPQLGDV